MYQMGFLFFAIHLAISHSKSLSLPWDFSPLKNGGESHSSRCGNLFMRRSKAPRRTWVPSLGHDFWSRPGKRRSDGLRFTDYVGLAGLGLAGDAAPLYTFHVANKKSSKTPVPKTSQKCWSILSSKHKKNELSKLKMMMFVFAFKRNKGWSNIRNGRWGGTTWLVVFQPDFLSWGQPLYKLAPMDIRYSIPCF